MKTRYFLFFITGFLLCSFIWLCSCASMAEALNRYPNDNIIEEAVEEVIEGYTGHQIDLTPSTPEAW